MKNKIYLIVLIITAFLAGCGDPLIDVTDVEFERKIVVEGYLYPGEDVKDFKLMKNFQLNQNINPLDIILIPNRDNVVATINGYQLQFNQENGTYYSDEFIPEYNKEYTLKVAADIDGKRYSCESTTLTPKKGFIVIEEDLGTIVYRSRDPEFNFQISEGTGFYMFSFRPLDASLDTYIYDNPYFPNQSREDVEENFNQFLYQLDLILNLNSQSPELINYKIKGLDTWFYSRYQIIVYAGDTNMKDYVLTVDNVQEPDGNFVEPRLNFSGDGLGVFASAIKDSVTFNLVKE